jgi:hypothetical protein
VKVYCFDFNDNYRYVEQREIALITRVFNNAPNSKKWTFNVTPDEGIEMFT